VAGIATAAILMRVAGRYGYDRDDLCLAAASKHVAQGYVHQPPLSVVLV
jgi:hypothetical protein